MILQDIQYDFSMKQKILSCASNIKFSEGIIFSYHYRIYNPSIYRPKYIQNQHQKTREVHYVC